jgi:phage recombination protein Bet
VSSIKENGQAMVTSSGAAISQSSNNSKEIIEYLNTFGIGKDLNELEKKQFLMICNAWNLSPIKREIHVSAYGQGVNRNCSIIIGYEVYIKRAEATGKLNGWRAWCEGEGDNLVAKIEIHRTDWANPFVDEVDFKEYAQYKKDGQLNKFWREKPKTMLKKVVTAQGFRKCFASELGGMPYDEAEIEVAMRDVSEQPIEKPAEGALSLLGKYFEKITKQGKITRDEAVKIFTKAKSMGDEDIFSMMTAVQDSITQNGKYKADTTDNSQPDEQYPEDIF